MRDPTDVTEHLQHEQSQQRQVERAQAAARQQSGEMPQLLEPGIQSVVDAARDLGFPSTKQEVLDVAGERPVRTSADVTMPLAAVLDKVSEDEFLSLRDFETAVLRHWEGVKREERPPEQRQQDSGADVEERP